MLSHDLQGIYKVDPDLKGHADHINYRQAHPAELVSIFQHAACCTSSIQVCFACLICCLSLTHLLCLLLSLCPLLPGRGSLCNALPLAEVPLL